MNWRRVPPNLTGLLNLLLSIVKTFENFYCSQHPIYLTFVYIFGTLLHLRHLDTPFLNIFVSVKKLTFFCIVTSHETKWLILHIIKMTNPIWISVVVNKLCFTAKLPKPEY